MDRDDDEALADAIGPGVDGIARYELEPGLTLWWGWEGGRFRLRVTSDEPVAPPDSGDATGIDLGLMFDGAVVPEATPSPRTIRFATPPLQPGPSRAYDSATAAADPRVARIFHAFDAVTNVLVGPDFVAVTISRPDRWEPARTDAARRSPRSSPATTEANRPHPKRRSPASCTAAPQRRGDGKPPAAPARTRLGRTRSAASRPSRGPRSRPGGSTRRRAGVPSGRGRPPRRRAARRAAHDVGTAPGRPEPDGPAQRRRHCVDVAAKSSVRSSSGRSTTPTPGSDGRRCGASPLSAWNRAARQSRPLPRTPTSVSASKRRACCPTTREGCRYVSLTEGGARSSRRGNIEIRSSAAYRPETTYPFIAPRRWPGPRAAASRRR